MSWGCSATTIKPRRSRPSETCPPLKEIPDEGVCRRRKKNLTPNNPKCIHAGFHPPGQHILFWDLYFALGDCGDVWGHRMINLLCEYTHEHDMNIRIKCVIMLNACNVLRHFFVISDPKLSPLQIRWTWCECEACHGDVLWSQLSPDAVGRRRPALRLRSFPRRVPAAGENFSKKHQN